MDPATETDDARKSGPTPTGGPMLVAAYPQSLAIPLPAHGKADGRAWLEAARLADKKVSAEHVIFRTRGGHVSVADAGSRNGTFVDGERLEPGDSASLMDGAVIRIGHTLLVYRAHFQGGCQPDPPLGDLVSPFGLRRFALDVERVLQGARGQRPSVLIEAETGAGKELLARFLHDKLRPSARYERINVTAIAATVFDSHLFGHVRGAFTGATTSSPGILRAVDGGSALLDEIGDLPTELQPKLLRLLENGEIQPVGATGSETVDVLVMGATNRNLAALADKEGFRRDLLNRFVWHLTVPPLNDRAEDVFAIADSLLHREVHHGYDLGSVDIVAVERLLLRDWSDGNVRALRRVVLHAGATSKRGELTEPAVLAALDALPRSPGRRRRTSLTRAAALAAKRAAKNESEAARVLGVDRGMLLRKLAVADD